MEEIHVSYFEKQSWFRRNELRDWLLGFPFTLSVTLTFKNDVSEYRAVQQLDRFVERLSAKLYGCRAQRSGKKFSMAAFMELQSGGRIHWHLLLYDVHGDGRFALSKNQSERTIRECCVKCSLVGYQINVQDINSYNQKKSVIYDTKKVGKDLENFHEKWL